MQNRKPQYHATTKKMMVAFTSLFDNIRVDLADGREIVVPLHYAQGEKFVDSVTRYVDKSGASQKPPAMPIMGYELVSMNYAPERHTPFNNRIQDKEMKEQRAFMYNRCPIDFQFDLYIAVKRIDDGLKIIEQIIPYFQPQVTLRVRGIEGLNHATNIPVLLTSYSSDIQADGSMDESRVIIYQMSFTLKGFLYTDVLRFNTINNSIINVKEDSSIRDEVDLFSSRTYVDDNGDVKQEIKE